MTAHIKLNCGESGFTLVELVASLVIFGFIGLGAAMFMVYAAKGYLLTQAATEGFQKSNIALDRLIKEFKVIEKIYDIQPDGIRYQRSGQDFGIALADEKIRLIRQNTLPDDESPGAILINNITGFVLEFKKPDGTDWTLPGDDSLTDLSTIRVQLTIRVENSEQTFTITINPVYNDMVNGPTA